MATNNKKWFSYFSMLPKGWMIKNDNDNQTPVVFVEEPQGGRLDDDGRNIYNKEVVQIITIAPEIIEESKELIANILDYFSDLDQEKVNNLIPIKKLVQLLEKTPNYEKIE